MVKRNQYIILQRLTLNTEYLHSLAQIFLFMLRFVIDKKYLFAKSWEVWFTVHMTLSKNTFIPIVLWMMCINILLFLSWTVVQLLDITRLHIVLTKLSIESVPCEKNQAVLYHWFRKWNTLQCMSLCYNLKIWP